MNIKPGSRKARSKQGGIVFYDKLSKAELINLLREKITASDPNRLSEYFRESIKNWGVENFTYIIMDNNLNVIKTIKHQGDVKSCALWPSQDWKKILNTPKAAKIAACHNHPGGSLKFSQEDMIVKTRIGNIAKLFDFNFVDFLVVTETGYLSAAETGNLEN